MSSDKGTTVSTAVALGGAAVAAAVFYALGRRAASAAGEGKSTKQRAAAPWAPFRLSKREVAGDVVAPRGAAAAGAGASAGSGGGDSGDAGKKRALVAHKSMADLMKRQFDREATVADSKPGMPRELTADVDSLREAVDIKVDTIYRLRVPELQDFLPAHLNAKEDNGRWFESTDTGQPIKYRNTIDDGFCILGDIVRHPAFGTEAHSFVRAGPRATTWFAHEGVRAAVVTCGGLCPGLNNVVREIVRSLHNLYGVTKVLGIREGFGGFYEHEPIELTVERVSDIHHWGGTVLGSSRGGFEQDKIVDAIKTLNLNQIYVIGGDGSHRGAIRLYEAFRAEHLNVAVCAIPKTVDNDVAFIDRSFGFNTAVEEAQRAIMSAKVEAQCAPNGIGVVKLMGRSSGYIAAHATLASGDVDLCLIPEVPTVLEGTHSCLEHLKRVVEKRGHAVVVVAEGVGEQLLMDAAKLDTAERDASGNLRLPPIAPWLKDRIVDFFTSKDMGVNVKVLDPSYMIRSVQANASDSLYCMMLAQNAVHGSMAGLTGFSVGLCNNRMVYLPMQAITKNSPSFMNPRGRTWERILSCTRQPNTVPERSKAADREEEASKPGTST